jgi:hypothetical protein
MYPIVSPYTCLPCADAWFYFVQYSLGFGLLVPRGYVEQMRAPRTLALTGGAPQVASLNMRANSV